MINSSIVMQLRASLKKLRLQLENGEEHNCTRHLHELADEAEDLVLAIGDTVGRNSLEAYDIAAKGGV